MNQAGVGVDGHDGLVGLLALGMFKAGDHLDGIDFLEVRQLADDLGVDADGPLVLVDLHARRPVLAGIGRLMGE